MTENIFDTHAHYADAAFDGDRDNLLRSMPLAGVRYVTVIGTQIEDSIAGLELARRYHYLYAAVGIHPEHDGTQPADYLDRLAALSRDPKCKAIGEIGLDYHYEGYDRESQKQLFRAQLDLAKQLHLPAVIHARDCTQDCVEILKEMRPERAVMHCYSFSDQTARELLPLGLYFGFTGVVSFKNAKKVHRAIQVIPDDRLLLETDCPYMAPEPCRGERSDSTMIAYTARAAAALRQTDPDTLLALTCRNAMTFYDIKERT